MKNLIIVFLAIVVLFSQCKNNENRPDKVTALKTLLGHLGEESDDSLFASSCNSMILVINSSKSLTVKETQLLDSTYDLFTHDNTEANPKQASSYRQRKRAYTVAWVSPTDGQVSFAQLTIPANWDPQKTYPLYVQLHGLWEVAASSVDYLTYPYLHEPIESYAFEDGYLVAPWGRGNFWYHDMSETDIFECIAFIEGLVKTDPERKYLCGHSMGGYGALRLGLKSKEKWAAIGLHAAALWYNNSKLVSGETANDLKEVPLYFVCGTQDQLKPINDYTFALMQQAGNQNIKFVTFEGGHEYRNSEVEGMYDWMKQFKKKL
jgi:predicted esterase